TQLVARPHTCYPSGMRRASVISVISAIFLLISAVSGAGKAKGGKASSPGKASAQTARAIDELQGKLKWGMTTDEIKKMLQEDVQKRHAEDWKKAVGNPEAQDKINATIKDEVDHVSKSYIEFTGQKTPWEVSIVDREFAHNNAEAMLVIEEGKRSQRRF